VPARVGGNIGTPLTEVAERAAPGEILVAEVSSFQLEATETFRPRVAVLLNVFPDHLDRHGTMEAYAAAKARLFANQQAEDTAIISRDDPGAWALRERTQARVIAFSTSRSEPEGADLAEGWLRVTGAQVCPVEAVRLPGRHNLGNALAALAAAHAVGASLAGAEETLRRFPGVEHRLESVATVGGVLFVNDSQATTPPATIAALEAFPGKVALLAGGRAKVHEWRELAEAVAQRNAGLILLGEAAEEIAAAARKAGVGVVRRATSLPEAVELAHREVRPEGVVLLSPACASFDMFANMSERGRAFKEAVRELARRETAG
jgi:UDP-N-acetylmuramoylalanine--D-glutamate ligase